MKWHQEIANKLNSKHSDTQAVIRSGKKGAKRRTTKHQRQLMKRADERLREESLGLTDSWRD